MFKQLQWKEHVFGSQVNPDHNQKGGLVIRRFPIGLFNISTYTLSIQPSASGGPGSHFYQKEVEVKTVLMVACSVVLVPISARAICEQPRSLSRCSCAYPYPCIDLLKYYRGRRGIPRRRQRVSSSSHGGKLPTQPSTFFTSPQFSRFLPSAATNSPR